MTKVLDKDSVKQKAEEYTQNNLPDYHKFYHRFINQHFDISLTYCPQPYISHEEIFSTYDSTKKINYHFNMSYVEDLILKEYGISLINKMVPTEDSNVLPLAVRYIDTVEGVYLVERPPCQINVDFSFKKAMYRKEIPFLAGKKIWIPWSLSLINFSPQSQSSYSYYDQRLFFSKKSITSLDDDVYDAILPNLFNDGRVCFGDSLYHLQQLIANGQILKNIASVFSFMFNDYFSAWNPDLSRYPAIAHAVLKEMNIFQRVYDSKQKKIPKYFEDLKAWRYSNNKYWASFLLCMSFLTYEETLEFYEKCSKIIRSKTSGYSNLNPKTVSEVIKSAYPLPDTEDVINYNFENFKASTIRNPYTSWLKTFNTFNDRSLFERDVEVVVTGIPKDTLIDSSIISNQNLVACIYYHVFKEYSAAFEKFCKKHKISIAYFSASVIGSQLGIPFMLDPIISWKNSLDCDQMEISMQTFKPDVNKLWEILHEFYAYIDQEYYFKPIKVKYQDVISNKLLATIKEGE